MSGELAAHLQAAAQRSRVACEPRTEGQVLACHWFQRLQL